MLRSRNITCRRLQTFQLYSSNYQARPPARFRKATISFVMPASLSLCLNPAAWNNSASAGRILIKFHISQKSFEKIQVLLKSDKNNGYFIRRHTHTHTHTHIYIYIQGGFGGLWYPRSRVRSRPKPPDFSGEKIHSMPSLGGK